MNGIFLSLSNTSNFSEYPNPDMQFMIKGIPSEWSIFTKKNKRCCVNVHMGYRIIVLHFPGAIGRRRGWIIVVIVWWSLGGVRAGYMVCFDVSAGLWDAGVHLAARLWWVAARFVVVCPVVCWLARWYWRIFHFGGGTGHWDIILWGFKTFLIFFFLVWAPRPPPAARMPCLATC